MKALLRFLRLSVVTLTVLVLLGTATVAGVYYYIEPRLPSVEALKDIRLQVPLRVYAAGGELIAEFGETKREPVSYANVPQRMVQAVLAAEDDRFFEHPGVDYQGLLRAAIHLMRTGEKGQGGSTITMQMARNFFLSREKTYLRKISEIFLALKIEQELSKEEILELYLNKIYLGQRAYGVGAAAQVYYGSELAELELAQVAMIAGLPKAPSAYNPVTDPKRAVLRRNYVLRRMHELGFIDDAEYSAAQAAGVSARLHSRPVEVDAPYVAEIVRAEMVSRYGEAAYSDGYSVYTSVDGRLQKAADSALRNALLDYTRRHGYRGPEATPGLPADGGPEQWERLLREFGRVGGLLPALVLELGPQSARVFAAGTGEVTVPWEGIAWARPYISDFQVGPEPENAADVLAPGQVIRAQPPADEGDHWKLANVPEVAGALVSLDPDDGSILALSGGFDYYVSKFNRVTQAKRQPGSNFKPFIYSAALESGYNLASLINDAPVVFEDDQLEAAWRPENYSGRFFGPTRMREALIKSRNLVSIRLLRSVGIEAAVSHAERFGFDRTKLSRDLSLALGSASLTPLEVATGYAVLANGGHRVEPYLIRRIEDADGHVVYRATPPTVCEECRSPEEEEAAGPLLPRIAGRSVDARNVFLVTSMMQDVIRRGTGRRALALERSDLAGKTGTTNDQRDAWFSGFNGDVVATAWVGFDNPRSLGTQETGGRAALPMWIDFMREALDGLPENSMEQPAGLVTVRIDPETGRLARADQNDAVFETFRAEEVPDALPETGPGDDQGGKGGGARLTEQLF